MDQISLFDLAPDPIPEAATSEPPHQPRSASNSLEYQVTALIRDRVKTPTDAASFVQELGSGCHKGASIHRYLQMPFWVATPERLVLMVAFQRNVMCDCHQTGSFDPK